MNTAKVSKLDKALVKASKLRIVSNIKLEHMYLERAIEFEEELKAASA